MGQDEVEDGNIREEMRLAPTMMASALSGALARFPCHPIDTIKARIQTQTWLKGSDALYNNFIHGVRDTFKHEGIRGLYRGFGPTVIGSIPASCLYFTTYELTKSTLGNMYHDSTKSKSQFTPFPVHFAGGMLAEAVSCVLWVPIDVVKERMQIQHVPRTANVQQLKAAQGDMFYSSGWDAMKSIIRTEGVVGFYRGYGATVMSFGPFSALYFAFYEQLKRAFELTLFHPTLEGDSYVSEMPLAVFLACGAIAGAGASFFTNPLDMVKLRLQVQRHNVASGHTAGEKYANMFDGLQKMYRHEGLRGMMRGVGARMAFHAPATAVGMALFEKLKTFTYAIV